MARHPTTHTAADRRKTAFGFFQIITMSSVEIRGFPPSQIIMCPLHKQEAISISKDSLILQLQARFNKSNPHDLEAVNATVQSCDQLQFEGKDGNFPKTQHMCLSIWNGQGERAVSTVTFLLRGNSAAWCYDRTACLCHLDIIHLLSCEWDATGEIIKDILHIADSVCGVIYFLISCLFGIHGIHN